MTEPVVRWTYEESWLMAELARRALVATLDAGPPVRAGERGFRAELHGGSTSIDIALALDAKAATLALAPEAPSGHRWREGWLLEVTRGDERWILEAGGAAVEIPRPKKGELRAHLRIRRRAVAVPLDGVDEVIALADPCFHRYTKQSTAARQTPTTELATWMTPTEPEPSPWWEIDFGAATWVAWLRVDLVRPPAGTIVACEVFGFAMPDGSPPPHARVFERRADELPGDDHVWFAVEEPQLARFVRVRLVAQTPVTLAVTATEACTAELYVDTLAGSLRRAFALHGERTLLAELDSTPRATYAEVWTRAMRLARGLAARVEVAGRRTTIGVMLRNRLAWILVELAAVARGYVVVAMSPEDDGDRLAHIVGRAQPDVVVCEASCAERLRRLDVRTLVADDDLDALAAAAPDDAPPPHPHTEDDLFCVLFTSGSTGMPKGAMRTYRTFQKMIASYAIGHVPRHVSFQPVSHMSERSYLPALMVHGGVLAFSRGGATLIDDLRAFGPTTVGTVPRVFEVLHAAYMRRVRADPADEPAALAEARASFGPNVMAVSVGSAPVSAEVFAFMKRCFTDIWVTEGYGSTEVGSIAFDGKLLDSVEVKLVPRADTPPAAPGDPERGEIWVRTPHAISGYLGDPDATRAALDADGYFATGDLGERDAAGRVRVIGRARNTVKLAQGEFVSAERIETALLAAPGVDRIYVHVEHGAPYVAAVVIPSSPEPAAKLLAVLRAHGAANGLAGYEVPHDILVETTEATVENGLVTANGKLARAAFHARFGARLSELAHGRTAVATGTGGTTLDRVLAAVRAVVRRDVDPREPLGTGVAIDSLASAEILAALSDEFGFDIPLGWWFEVRDLAELAARLDRTGGGSSTQAELAREDLALPALAVVSSPSKLERVLLTGATGLLGSHLAAAFANAGIAVRCLVRAPDDTAAERRLREVLAARSLAGGTATHAMDPEALARVAAIAGDLGAELGEAIVDGVDAIVHAGATVSWLASYAALRGPNVRGTHRLLELAAARGLPFHHISTISCAPLGGDEATALPFEVAAAGTPYGLSKWIAEEHVRRAAAAGLPVAIYRPAMIAPDTRSGLGNREDYLHRLMQGYVDLGLYIADDEARVDFTPVDYVASAIARLAVTYPRGGRTIHVVNVDRSPTFAGLGRAMIAAGAALAPAPYAEFRAALLRHRTTRLHALAAFFPEIPALGMGPWPCAASHAAISDAGVTRPYSDEAYVRRIFCVL